MSEDIEALAKAAQARRELEITGEAFEMIRQAALEAVVQCAPEQQRRLDRLVMTVQIIDGVRKVLDETIANGSVAYARMALAEAGIFSPR